MTFSATFDQSVAGVDVFDFRLAATGTVVGTISQVSGSASYFITVTGISGDGTLGVNLVDDSSIHDLAGNVLSNSTGAFSIQPANTYSSFSANAVAVADFDHDGNLDVVAVDQSTGSAFQLFLGNGNGTLKTPKTLAGITRPDTALAGDFNGDGVPDLFESSPPAATIAVLLGNGNGTFKNPQTYGVDGNRNTKKVALADLNGDGKLDVVVTSYSNDISVFLGNGDGTLKPRVVDPNGHSEFVVISDVDRDGIPDLVVGNAIDNTVNLFVGIGDGTFRPPVGFTSNHPSGMALADFDGDGSPDLVTSDYSANVYVMHGNGNGTFGTAHRFPARASRVLSRPST